MPTIGAAIMNRLVIWGASGHARVVADVVRCEGKHEILAFVDNTLPAGAGRSFQGLPLVNGLEELAGIIGTGFDGMLIAIGDCRVRSRLAESLRRRNIPLLSAIHPGAVVSRDARIGAGCVVVAGAVVNAGARIGDNVIVNTSASIDHDCLIEAGVHIGPAAHLAGQVRVGAESCIGIGCIVKDRVRIGARCLLGAGSLLLKDLPDEVVAYGSPARIVSQGGKPPP